MISWASTVAQLLLVNLSICFAIASGSDDCAIAISRQFEIPPRIIPVPGEKFAVVWQDNNAIRLQRFLQMDCNKYGDEVLLNQSSDFWSTPADSGLADAARLGPSGIVVAWVLNGEVWVQVVSEQPGQAVLAHGPEKTQRSQVRISSDPAGSGFLVVWNAWQKEADAWGAFARKFDSQGNALTVELQINQELEWRKFQWQPQISWCGNSLWGLWLKMDQNDCQKALCVSGPFLRYLGQSSGNWTPGPEVDLQGDRTMSAALTCSDGDAAASIWLEKEGTEVRWNYSEPPGRTPKSRQLRSWMSEALTFRAAWDFTRPLLDTFTRRSWEVGELSAPAPQLGELGDPAPHLKQPGSGISPGEVSLIAQSGYLLLMSSASLGKLEAQLLNFGASRSVLYPVHSVALAAQNARAVLDPSGGRLAVSMCWGSGDMLGSEDPPAFHCTYRSAAWLMEGDGMGIGGELTVLALFTLLFILCLLKQSAQQGGRFGFGNRAMSAARREAQQALTERRAQRSAARARVNELRDQIAQIPMVPLGNRPPAAAGETSPPAATAPRNPASEEVATSGEGAGSPANPCPICLNEVVVRVALQPCGHTACRDCTLRLVELAQPCHVCRGPIEGVLPVYI